MAQKSDTFLHPKNRGQEIIVCKFILPYRQLNLVSLTLKKREEVIQQTELIFTEAVKNFEYGKNNN